MTYAWLQIAGPSVALNGSNTLNPIFVSPGRSSTTVLKFSFTAKDDNGAAGIPAVVTVSVKPVNRPPTANAGLIRYWMQANISWPTTITREYRE